VSAIALPTKEFLAPPIAPVPFAARADATGTPLARPAGKSDPSTPKPSCRANTA